MDYLEETNSDDIPSEEEDDSFNIEKNKIISSLMDDVSDLWRYGRKVHFNNSEDNSYVPRAVFQLRKQKNGKFEKSLSLFEISSNDTLCTKAIFFFKELTTLKILKISENDRAVSLLKRKLLSNITDIDTLNCFKILDMEKSNHYNGSLKHWGIKNIPTNGENIPSNLSSKKQVIETLLANSSIPFLIEISSIQN